MIKYGLQHRTSLKIEWRPSSWCWRRLNNCYAPMSPLIEATCTEQVQRFGTTWWLYATCLATLTSCIFILQSVAYSPLQVDITDTQLTMAEQVSFTRFLCCACHDRGEVSAFFGTRRLRSCIFRAMHGVKLLVRASSRFLYCTGTPSGRRIMKLDLLAHQDIGQRVLCRQQAQKVPPPARHAHMMLHRIRHRYMHNSISVYTDVKHWNLLWYTTACPYIPI